MCLKQEGYKPKPAIKLALICGEETSKAFNGARYLATKHKDWIKAEFAINDGGGTGRQRQTRHVWGRSR